LDIANERVGAVIENGRFSATSDFRQLAMADAIIICVPTPLGEHAEPDLSFVTAALDLVKPYLRPGQIVSLESTTYPGTTDEEVVPAVTSRGLTVGRDAFVVFSPEREDPGNAKYSTKTIPKVCGGVTPDCLEVGMALYGQVIDQVVPVSSAKAAEMTKLLENIHRAVNIGLVNELKTVADRMGIDIHEVITAAATKPFGFVAYQPGPGLGGHCIPIDPFYLTWKAKEFGVKTRFIELAGEVNASMPEYVVSKVVSALNARRKSVRGSTVLVLGLAYKKNVADTRESPSLDLIHRLHEMGAEIVYADPYVPSHTFAKGALGTLNSIDLATTLEKIDCVLVATDHDCFDYDAIGRASLLIVDTRGRYRGEQANVVRA